MEYYNNDRTLDDLDYAAPLEELERRLHDATERIHSHRLRNPQTVKWAFFIWKQGVEYYHWRLKQTPYSPSNKPISATPNQTTAITSPSKNFKTTIFDAINDKAIDDEEEDDEEINLTHPLI